jgi:hypothetical protein
MTLKSGFKIPEDYFEKLESRFEKKKQSNTKSGFKLPNGYFDKFEVPIKKEKKNFKLQFIKSTIYTGIAASIILILFLTLNFSKEKADLNDLSVYEIENYILENDIEYLLYDDDNFSDLSQFDYLDETEVESYIINEIDIENLIY